MMPRIHFFCVAQSWNQIKKKKNKPEKHTKWISALSAGQTEDRAAVYSVRLAVRSSTLLWVSQGDEKVLLNIQQKTIHYVLWWYWERIDGLDWTDGFMLYLYMYAYAEYDSRANIITNRTERVGICGGFLFQYKNDVCGLLKTFFLYTFISFLFAYIYLYFKSKNLIWMYKSLTFMFHRQNV